MRVAARRVSRPAEVREPGVFEHLPQPGLAGLGAEGQPHLLRHAIVVPWIWLLEVGNGLLVGERRRRATPAESDQFLNVLRTYSIAIDEPRLPGLSASILPIARRFHLTAYDAAYLELAYRRGLPLATLDKKLAKAAAAAGVPRFTQ